MSTFPSRVSGSDLTYSSQCTPLPPGFTTTEDGEYVSVSERLRNPGYSIPEISAQNFFDFLLPPLRDGIAIQDVISSLKAEGLFDSFNGLSASPTNEREDEMFVPLADIFNEATFLAAMASPHLRQTIRLVLLGNPSRKGRRVPHAIFSVNNAKDNFTARSVHNEILKTFSWADVAFTSEFDFGMTGEVWDNIVHNRIILDIQQIMARDPCRRFAFGITVVETTMRLWFCSRATPVVSQPFDFTTEPEMLIHAFLSLAFASKEELGWDSTVRTLTDPEGNRIYHIDITNETYETLQLLSDGAAEELTSHGTRVWKVRRVGSDELYVVKDVWVEDGRDLEHSILETILNDVEEKYGSDVRKQVASHLLIPVAHWLVPIREEEDHTVRVMMRGHLPRFKNRIKISIGLIDEVDDIDTEESLDDLVIQESERRLSRAPLPWCNRKLKMVHRRHYRILYEEVATALYAIRNLPDIFTVLSDSANVLKWIHGCGWVHRDVSAGNLYLYNGRGLIGDFEHAKRKQTDIRHEHRIGTPDFMAIEATRRFYAHLPDDDPSHVETEGQTPLEHRIDESCSRKGSDLSPPFFHNDLHDLESLWWITIWVLFSYRSFSGNVITGSRERESEVQRRSSGAELFPGNSDTENRRMFLVSKEIYFRRFSWMPDCLRSIKATLNTLRRILIWRYRKFEAAFPTIQMDVIEGVHDRIGRNFLKCKALAASLRSNEKKFDCSRIDRSAREHHTLPASSTRRSLKRESLIDRVPSMIETRKFATDDAAGPLTSIRTNGKRKRDDDDSLPCMRPLRMARYELPAKSTKFPMYSRLVYVANDCMSYANGIPELLHNDGMILVQLHHLEIKVQPT
ncbi:hypothetical protein ACEPAF_9259 [Sanghuangporus sanghuang]